MQVGGTDSGLGFSSDHENFISHVLSEAKLKGPNRRRLWGPVWVGPNLRSYPTQGQVSSST